MNDQFTDHNELTCVINVKNGEDFIRYSIDSAINQSIPIDILVVDNLSTDKTVDIVKEYPEVRLVVTPTSNGLGHARNFSLQHVHTKYVCWLDADDKWCPDFCERSLKVLKDDMQLKLVSSSTVLIDPHGIPLPEKDQRLASNNNLPYLVEGDTIEKISQQLRCKASWQSYVFLTEEVKKVGGFNTKYRFAPDLDLVSRVILSGKAAHINSNLSYCRIHPNQMTSTFPPEERYNESKEIVHHALDNTGNQCELTKDDISRIVMFRIRLAYFLEQNSIIEGIKAMAMMLDPRLASWTLKRYLSRNEY